MDNILVIYITYPNEKTAQSICSDLLSNKLIACANIHSVQSMYNWNGEIKNEVEWVSIVKSTESKWEDLQSKIISIHPYDVPCITRWNANANDKYSNWVNTECK